jgi:cold shock CspA family protein
MTYEASQAGSEKQQMARAYEDRMMKADPTLAAPPGVERMGHIVFWRADRGYGFIHPDGEHADIFFHIRDVVGGGQVLGVGDRVTFDLGVSPRNGGAQARRVTPIEAGRGNQDD